MSKEGLKKKKKAAKGFIEGLLKKVTSKDSRSKLQMRKLQDNIILVKRQDYCMRLNML